MRVTKDIRNRKIVCESSSISLINFFPFENIALKIKDNSKMIGADDDALNYNVEKD
jgi:hypothetical protein